MCGIVGFNWEDKELVKKMASTLEHRGPDDYGHYTDNNVSLGQRRLSILDLSKKGKQPMSDSDGKVWITYNGEVYNFREIRKELENKGHKFNSNTDTEVILYGYKEWGIKILEKLNGMFAFCIYDSEKKDIFLARDRMGIKPLYYYWKDGKLIFASELKAIIRHDIKKRINKEAVKEYLTFGYILAPKSIFENIYKMRPGEYATLKDNKLTLHKYWSLNYAKKINKSKDYFEKEILRHLEESVKKRLISDVPVGAFLSGGIDSSAIVAMLKKFKPDLKTFSISFEHKEFNESEYAKKVSEFIGTDHYETAFDADYVTKLIPKLVYHYDEPFADPSMIPTYLVSKVARKHVTVSLSGDGGDESFGGYERYNWYKMIKWHRHTPKLITRTIFRPAVNLAYKTTKAHFFNKGKMFIEGNKFKDYELYAKTLAFTSDELRNRLSVDKIQDPFKAFKPHFDSVQTGDKMLNCDFNIYLPDDILTKLDRASMAVGLEARVPFLDHHFIEFTSQIPFGLKVKGLTTKYIFKKALKNTLPKEIINRKKKGFGVPLKHYFRKELKDYLQQKLLDKDCMIKQFVHQNEIKKIYDKHQSGKEDNNYILYGLLMLEEWMNKWSH